MNAQHTMKSLNSLANALDFARETEVEYLLLIDEAREVVYANTTGRVAVLNRRQLMELDIMRVCQRGLLENEREYARIIDNAYAVSAEMGNYAWNLWSSLRNNEMEYYGA